MDGALDALVGHWAGEPSHLFDDPKLPLRRTFREKCKRFRTDGPTPCLCCPGECVGQWPGFTYQEACSYRDGAMDGGREDHTTPELKVFPTWAAVLTAVVLVAVIVWCFWKL